MRDTSTIISEGVEMMKSMTDEELIKFRDDVKVSYNKIGGDDLVKLMVKSMINNEFIRRGLLEQVMILKENF